jgi:DNA-binding MarR family transcriptional regulator
MYKHSASILGKLGRVRSSALRVLSESVGLHLAQPPILSLLKDEPNLTQNEIAQRLSLTQASVTMNLARMEKAGLIYKSPDEEDGRKLRINSTSLGAERFTEIEKLLEEFEGVMFQGFNETEKQALLVSLTKVIDNIENALPQ